MRGGAGAAVLRAGRAHVFRFERAERYIPVPVEADAPQRRRKTVAGTGADALHRISALKGEGIFSGDGAHGGTLKISVEHGDVDALFRGDAQRETVAVRAEAQFRPHRRAGAGAVAAVIVQEFSVRIERGHRERVADGKRDAVQNAAVDLRNVVKFYVFADHFA